MIWALYPLGDGSEDGDEELRYSLRSLERHAKGVERVVIVGKCPDFIDRGEVLHIEMEESSKEFPWWNVMYKIHRAFEETGEPRFFFMNDDFFLVKDVDAENYPFYYRGVNRGKLNCRLHVPCIYEREIFERVFEQQCYNFDENVSLRSLYGEEIRDHLVWRDDVKLFSRKAVDVEKWVAGLGTEVFSTSPDNFKGNVERWLAERYCEKCRWEK